MARSKVDVAGSMVNLVRTSRRAQSIDDGYRMQMARVADRAGYMSNYFRWFSGPEIRSADALQPAGTHDARQRHQPVDQLPANL